MPVFLRDNFKVLFIHIPKTGGTSVEKTFLASGWDISYHHAHGSGPISIQETRTCSPQHYHAEILELLFRAEKFELVFTITRHPVARFISEYTRQTLRQNTYDPTPAAIINWGENKFKQYQTNPFLLDNHIRPQSEFLLPNTVCLKLEDGLDHAFNLLDKKYQLRVDNLRKHANRSAIDIDPVQIDSSVEKMIEEFYSEDFINLGY